jgi:hypothetical protein
MFSRALFVACLFGLFFSCAYGLYAFNTPQTQNAIASLKFLKQSLEEGLISEKDYETRKQLILDQATGIMAATMNVGNDTANITLTPEVQFLLKQLFMGLPRSYSDILPNGQNFWLTRAYLE